jgi:hypothetical protein
VTARQRLAFAFWMAIAGMLTLRLVEVFPGQFLAGRVAAFFSPGHVPTLKDFWEWRYFDAFVVPSAAISAWLLAPFPPISLRLGNWSGAVRGTLVAMGCHLGTGIGSNAYTLISQGLKQSGGEMPGVSTILTYVAFVLPLTLLGVMISLFVIGGVTIPCMALASAAFDRLRGRR